MICQDQPHSLPKYQLKSFKRYSLSSPLNTLKLYDHSAVVWGKYMYIWGGDNNKLSKISIKKQANYHKVHLQNMTWQTILGSALVPFHAHSHCCQLVGHEMYLFGGSDESCKSNNTLWCYNFIAKVFQKLPGWYPPSPRQSASMVKVEDNLVLYGGINLEAKEIYNEFYLYQRKHMTWNLLTPNKQIPMRTLQKMVSVKNKAYIFGGNNESGVSALNDFYRITILDKKQCDVQKIETQITPPARMSHGMLDYRNKYIIVIGGEKELKKRSQFLNDAWIFDTEQILWSEIDLENKFPPSSHFSMIEYGEKVIVFGGMKVEGVDDNLLIMEFQESRKPFEMEEKKKHQAEKIYFQSQLEVKQPNFDFLVKAANMIKFPFAAFGLLIDNCMNSHATMINISVFDKPVTTPPLSTINPTTAPLLQSSKSFCFDNKDPINLKGLQEVQRYIIIDDNGRTWNNQQMQSIIFNSTVPSPLAFDVAEKKTKQNVMRQNLKKEFGTNLKFGCFRLGKGFLYVSGFQNYLRVALIAIDLQEKYVGCTRYKSLYYVEDVRNKRFVTENGAEIKKEVEKICKNYLRPRALEDLSMMNQLYIFNLESFYTVRGTFYQLNPYNNDYIYNCLHEVQFLNKINFPILECPDVSLRSYLSLLYLKNDTKITLQTTKRGRQQQIQNQLFINKIDRQKQRGFVKQIDYANLYPQLAQCKIVQMYYDQTMDQRCDSFHSGILIYHKNRLISRFKYDLGRLFQDKFYPRRYRKGRTNVLQFFGYIQLPDEMLINVFKTGAEHPLLLEGFNSNIQLIIKDMKRRLQVKARPEMIPSYLEIHDKFEGGELKHFMRKEERMKESRRQEEEEEEEEDGLEDDDGDDDENDDEDESDDNSQFQVSNMSPIDDLLRLKSDKEKKDKSKEKRKES